LRITQKSCDKKIVHLDVEKLKDMRERWEKLVINNYSFTYIIDGVCSSYVIDNVVIKNKR